jgi:hypothetical protein
MTDCRKNDLELAKAFYGQVIYDAFVYSQANFTAEGF